MSDRDPPTQTHARVFNLEQDMRELRAHVHTIGTDVSEIRSAVVAMRDTAEATAREASSFRESTQATLRCMRENNDRYRPALDDVLRKQEEAKQLRRHVKFAWMTAAGLAIGGGIMTWLDSKWKALAVLLSKGV